MNCPHVEEVVQESLRPSSLEDLAKGLHQWYPSTPDVECLEIPFWSLLSGAVTKGSEGSKIDTEMKRPPCLSVCGIAFPHDSSASRAPHT